MVAQEKMIALYETVIDSIELTSKKLIEMGFDQNDVNELVAYGSLVQRQGQILFIDSNALYDYRRALIRQGLGKRASLCYKRCLEINPDHVYLLMDEKITEKDFLSAYRIVEFYLLENDLSKAITIMFLLSNVYDLPEKLQRNVFRSVGEKKKQELSEFLQALFDYKFVHAKKLYLQMDEEVSMNEKRLILRLLNLCIQKSNILKKRIVDLANTHKWKALKLKLEQEQKMRGLNNMYVHILMVLEDYFSDELPEVVENDAKNAMEAIEFYDYEKALAMLKEFLRLRFTNELASVLELLLTDIIKKKNEPEEKCESNIDVARIDNLVEVMDTIVSGKMSITQAGAHFSLTEAQICLVKLEFAKGFYKICYDDIAGRLVEEVKMCNLTSPCLDKAMEEASIACNCGLNLSDPFALVLKRINIERLLEK